MQLDVWKDGTQRVKVKYDDGSEKWEDKTGPCYGPFIILPGTAVGTLFMCHVPTSSDMIYLRSQELLPLLKRIGEYLADTFRITFRQKHKLLLHSKLPKWVSAWVKTVMKEAMWVDPVIFRDDHPELHVMAAVLTPEQIEEIENE